ncbi:MAG: polyprenyl synthetase family protein [Candidatus Hecatellales archaeon]|nr:MAG: polyprenyl synthetase family protein [Candidatus Hecatellales archaeon]
MDTSSGLEWPSDLAETARKVKSYIEDFLETVFPPAQTLYQASRHLFTTGGKMLRPYMAVKACEVVGGSAEQAVPAAAAVEMLHTFTLIHDDIIDRDEVRRGLPAVHVKWGEPVAILAGDFLFSKVFLAVSRGLKDRGVPSETVARVVEVLADATGKICEGQMLDMSFEGRETVSEEEYLAMVERKTAYLFKASSQIGALIGGAGEDWVERLGEYGRLAGIGFQMVDDVLGLVADEAKLGKPVGSDLREGKKTMPIIYALSRASVEQRKTILEASVKPERMGEALKLIVSLGGIDYAKTQARKYVEAALEQLKPLPETPAKKSLETLAKILVEREF